MHILKRHLLTIFSWQTFKEFFKMFIVTFYANFPTLKRKCVKYRNHFNTLTIVLSCDRIRDCFMLAYIMFWISDIGKIFKIIKGLSLFQIVPGPILFKKSKRIFCQIFQNRFWIIVHTLSQTKMNSKTAKCLNLTKSQRNYSKIICTVFWILYLKVKLRLN